MYSLEMHERELQRAGQLRTLRVAGSVRNPLVMIASAYCYHHRGQEDTNVTSQQSQYVLYTLWQEYPL